LTRKHRQLRAQKSLPVITFGDGLPPQLSQQSISAGSAYRLMRRAASSECRVHIPATHDLPTHHKHGHEDFHTRPMARLRFGYISIAIRVGISRGRRRWRRSAARNPAGISVNAMRIGLHPMRVAHGRPTFTPAHMGGLHGKHWCHGAEVANSARNVQLWRSWRRGTE
jgi:hypothetical protein